MPLAKATLRHQDGGKDIVFMFNPAKLAFSVTVNTIDNSGARSPRSGRPRVGFSSVQPKTLTLDQLYFDTYETKENVFDKHIAPLVQATQFLDSSGNNKEDQRPPTFSFVWGDEIYFEYCFVETLSYELNKFLPNGMPVRAIVTGLTLKETDKSSDSSSSPKPQADPAKQNRGSMG